MRSFPGWIRLFFNRQSLSGLLHPSTTAHTESALFALSCPLSLRRHMPADQEDAPTHQKGSTGFVLCSENVRLTLNQILSVNVNQ